MKWSLTLYTSLSTLPTLLEESSELTQRSTKNGNMTKPSQCAQRAQKRIKNAPFDIFSGQWRNGAA